MSFMVIYVVKEGIIMGADRNITRTQVINGENTIINLMGQTQRPKVLRWPNNKAIIGYVGAGQIGNQPTDEWLYEFIGNNLEFHNFEELSESLRSKIQAQRTIDEADNHQPEPLIIHLAGFERDGDYVIPVIYYIHNHHNVVTGKLGEYYSDIRSEFICSEEFIQYIRNIPKEKIREYVDYIAKNGEAGPLGFRQGYDIHTFNAFDSVMNVAMEFLSKLHPNHHEPNGIYGWKQRLEFIIRVYEAYFQTYYEPSEQFVGGGVDLVSIEWPSS